MIEDIKERAFESPDDAQQSLEALARSCLHPDVYRALLKLYRLRNTEIFKMLREARTLWSITGDSQDSLLWDITKSFKLTDVPRATNGLNAPENQARRHGGTEENNKNLRVSVSPW